ncbi:hypothetical protein IMZ48_34555, partial [Candidatus Bathyarchaeota archaeon]|nr:hypothetical protein [Candidatus Bathyarchaeota archaeon]
SSGVGTTKAWRASFWNLASFDYINSYARRDKPRLEFNDVRLWEASGLPMTRIDEQHIPRSLIRNHDFKERMSEKMACRTLIWVVLKTLYFVFLNDQDSAGCVGNGVYHGHTESFHWHQIDQHLNDWYGALPNTFETCLRISNPSQRSIDPMPQPPSPFATAPTATIPFPQLFYTSSMGATALLLYHFTRILVLLNKPPDDPRRQTGVGRLQWHRRFSQQINHHAEEICGIAIGRPQPGVQIHLVQPLYLAGLCLDSDERKVVLADLLVGVQRRTGYSTEWRVIKLKEEWGWVDNP